MRTRRYIFLLRNMNPKCASPALFNPSRLLGHLRRNAWPTGTHLRPGFAHQIVALGIVEIIVAVKCASRDAIRSSAMVVTARVQSRRPDDAGFRSTLMRWLGAKPSPYVND
jgi:hypothetical protein